MVSDSGKSVCQMALENCQNKIAKKHQKHEIVNKLWKIPGPKQSILPTF